MPSSAAHSGVLSIAYEVKHRKGQEDMRLEVFCEDRVGLTRELLDLLVGRGIDLRGIEIDTCGRIYLSFPEIDFENFSSLMTEIRRITGITDVRKVRFMPVEREHTELKALVHALPDPVFSVDVRGRIDLANHAALALFAMNETQLRDESIQTLLAGFHFQRWFEQDNPEVCLAEHIEVRGQDYLMDLTPVYITHDDDPQKPLLAGAVLMLRSSAKLDYVLQPVNVHDEDSFSHVLADSSKMKQVVLQAKKLSMLDAPLLIEGETGTGKEMLARACHLRSARGSLPFLGLNCAALPDSVAESELFGHAPGAYPGVVESKKGFFEQASGGTVFLDEIGEMSSQMQAKLLRFLNDGTFRRVGEDHEVSVDVRVICSTQRNLLDLVHKGVFREDLYYRLNVLTLTVPPLRERQLDIPELAMMFITQIAHEMQIERPIVVPELMPFLTQYAWPGNVRQLRNAIYRALSQLDGHMMTPQCIDLPELEAEISVADDQLTGSLDEITKRFERSVLTRLYRSYPSTRKLARRLGVSHTAIANKLREYGLGKHHHDEAEK